MNAVYRMNECHLALTGEDWLDCTMQVIRNTRTQTSLVITRAFIPEDRTFDDELAFQWAQVDVNIMRGAGWRVCLTKMVKCTVFSTG